MGVIKGVYVIDNTKQKSIIIKNISLDSMNNIYKAKGHTGCIENLFQVDQALGIAILEDSFVVRHFNSGLWKGRFDVFLNKG